MFPPDFSYSSDTNFLPIEFFLEAIPRSQTIDLLLGYFSSTSISTLAVGFAPFVVNGGKLRIISNHELRAEDAQLVRSSADEEQQSFPYDFHEGFIQEIDSVFNALRDPYQQHFINCLKFLKDRQQLELIPVKLITGNMVHYKQGILTDFDGNNLGINGSCNFTANGLLENGETIKVYRSWGGDYEVNTIESEKNRFSPIFDRISPKFEYLARERIEGAIDQRGETKSSRQLLDDELRLVGDGVLMQGQKLLAKYKEELEKAIGEEKSKPHFPFTSGPHDYQKQAGSEWRRAGQKGIFAMATGTGKTITSLNCLFEEWLVEGLYQAVVLVPSELLVVQWDKEVRQFNFRNIILVSSKHPNWMRNVRELSSDLRFDSKRSFVVIATYASYVNNLELLSKNLPSEALLIADEAHNVGAPKMRSVLGDIKQTKRLGLSATPRRDFDDEGNLAIEHFFDSAPPYTYSFPMARAIEEGYLCKYYYFPQVVFLDLVEMESYREISLKLAKFFHVDSQKFMNNPAVKSLLLERKRIIHKARAKLPAFKKIVSQELERNPELKFGFVYSPEGAEDSGLAIIDQFMAATTDITESIRVASFTQMTRHKEEVLKNFEDGYINLLFAMKCLDEGVDIPRTELAIFCSSTGTSRQFVQRRGRIIRTHAEKQYARIYDLVVFPASTGTTDQGGRALERRFVSAELKRVVEFAGLAQNYGEAMEMCNSVANEFSVDIYAVQDELEGATLDLYGSDDFEEEV